MRASTPITEFDDRFSHPEARALPWAETEAALGRAELYWITTVRANGRPHVVPLIGLWHEGGFIFCTGLTEQKYRNLEHHRGVAVTTGANRWASGLDVVVEGDATRVVGANVLSTLATAYFDKYGEEWRLEPGDDCFNPTDGPAAVFLVSPTKVLAFAKDPHGQTRYLFT